MKNYRAEVFSKEKYKLGESPFYDPRTKTLSWVDITEGKLYTLGPDGSRRIYNFGQAIGAAVPAKKPGSYLVAASDALYLLDAGVGACGLASSAALCDGASSSGKLPASPVVELSASPRLIKSLSEYYEPYQRSNDAKADPSGRLWFGSSVDDGIHPASGNLFCLDTLAEGGKTGSGSELKVICRQPDTKISNGLAWSRDGKSFFFSDSLEYAVFSYDYDSSTGQISNRKVLFSVEGCVPDGMCIDADDNLWVAFWGGSRIEQRSTKDGSLLATIQVDAEHVTSCAFMGDKLDTLFITSSGDGLKGELDGCLFTCQVQAQGLGCDYCELD
ncbi:MAG: SMP-30/gluconolactonase/LRE family protein [Treponemataceae bacterium]|nr:SMP-30/gluconolactonase/LRE family protein [Treponemataceae bacterium]